jgi:hypothetical protein
MTASNEAGLHAGFAGDDPRERFLAALFDRLWETYRERVPHVRTYERVVAEHGGRFVNDHIAFRTLATQQPSAGMHTLVRPFEALGYLPAGCYEFPDKSLSAIHLQHANADFPKLFVSELRTWELSDAAREIVARALAGHRPPLADATLAALRRIDGANAGLLDELVRLFHDRPWSPPERADVEALNAESQYGAWVLLHGYAVNHFTALVNSHGVASLNDIDRTIAALVEAGVPMKDAIEGEPGSKLRQTATAAANVDVAVRENGSETTLPWTYAYFELAERGTVPEPTTGRQTRFEGFLGAQATQLFEMTRKG